MGRRPRENERALTITMATSTYIFEEAQLGPGQSEVLVSIHCHRTSADFAWIT
jgi:hypothetical protein